MMSEVLCRSEDSLLTVVSAYSKANRRLLQERQFITRTSPTSAKAKAKKEVDETPSYFEIKKAAKERRRELYEAQQQRKERLKTRRKGPGDGLHRRGAKRQEFRDFFIRKKVNEEYMNRKARQAGLDWKIQVAVILERISVVLPDKPQWEADYDDLKTHLLQFGKMYPKDLYDVDYDADIAISDEELLEKHLPKGYEPAPRETEADLSGDVRTTNRKLKTSVFLTVLETDKGNWELPTVDVLPTDQSLLRAARRAVKEKVGSHVEFWCPSNAPFAVDMTTFPSPGDKGYRDEYEGLYGCKKFFMKVQYDEGDVSSSTMSVADFAWLDREEIVERVKEQQGGDMSKFYHYML